ncbi:hypothetical protein GWI33_020708 [Rhynchophorus ferrugineus]|uniref:Uncharacterized protein n=1 Tax=Rhynchophorus ferrugineus TaxID=354439 RepID=A0A834HU14_RHYFE|nr:hypothetical protein GWI33_020708 [Rhynchophorus ferrugineus]
MLQLNFVVCVSLLTFGLLLASGQQYVPVQILVPVNSSYSTYFNYSVYSPQANYTKYGYIPPTSGLNYTNYGSLYPTSGLNYTNFGYVSPIYRQNYTNYTWNNYTKQFEPASYYINQFPGYNVSVPSNYNATQDGHLFVGYIQPNDKLLFNQTYRREKSWFSGRELTLTYPPGESTRFELISAIRIYNRFLDGTSCRATILSGGIGSQFVEISLKSFWRKGFLYNVQIYGH